MVQYPHPISDQYLKEIQNANDKAEKDGPDEAGLPSADAVVAPDTAPQLTEEGPAIANTDAGQHPAKVEQDDTPDVPMRFSEKKRLHWSGKTCAYLAKAHRLGLTTLQISRLSPPLETW